MRYAIRKESGSPSFNAGVSPSRDLLSGRNAEGCEAGKPGRQGSGVRWRTECPDMEWSWLAGAVRFDPGKAGSPAFDE